MLARKGWHGNWTAEELGKLTEAGFTPKMKFEMAKMLVALRRDMTMEGRENPPHLHTRPARLPGRLFPDPRRRSEAKSLAPSLQLCSANYRGNGGGIVDVTLERVKRSSRYAASAGRVDRPVPPSGVVRR